MNERRREGGVRRRGNDWGRGGRIRIGDVGKLVRVGGKGNGLKDRR